MATVLVTGAGGGFGRLIARALQQAGHTVFGTLRDIEGRNRAVASELTAEGVQILEVDVTSDASVDAAARTLLSATSRLDVVINNSGVGVAGPQEAFTADDLHRVFDVNVYGAHRVTRAFAPHLRANGQGLVVFVSSLLGRITVPYYGPYNATKWALEAIAENYAIELAGNGVEVAIVEPGGFPTTFHGNLLRPSDAERVRALPEHEQGASQFGAAFAQALAAHPEQNPQLVADAILRLVEAAPGTRPFRTAVDTLGMGAQVERVNDALEQATRGVYQAFGIDDLLARRSEGVLVGA